MNEFLHLEDLGKPALTIAGLRLWIHGKESPDLVNSPDGDWLLVSAICEVSGACVSLRNEPCLQSSEIDLISKKCIRLLRREVAETRWDPVEPNVNVIVKRSAGELFEVRIEITPNVATQAHRFDFDEIHSSDLEAIVKDCENVLTRFPRIA
jgi:hypothetical protein